MMKLLRNCVSTEVLKLVFKKSDVLCYVPTFLTGYRNGPNETDPYGLSPQYWHVFAARLAFVVIFEVNSGTYECFSIFFKIYFSACGFCSCRNYAVCDS